jgi:small subunit ribosomal protein S27e
MTTLDVDILHPSALHESQTNKKKTLVPNPRSSFLSLKCADCIEVTTAFSHSNVPVTCAECGKVLAYPTGGRLRLAEGVDVREKITA